MASLNADTLTRPKGDEYADFETGEHVPDLTPRQLEALQQQRLEQTRQRLRETLHGGGWFNEHQASGEAP